MPTVCPQSLFTSEQVGECCPCSSWGGVDQRNLNLNLTLPSLCLWGGIFTSESWGQISGTCVQDVCACVRAAFTSEHSSVPLPPGLHYQAAIQSQAPEHQVESLSRVLVNPRIIKKQLFSLGHEGIEQENTLRAGQQSQQASM